MKTLARLVLGLVILDAAVTAPTLEPIHYDSETYDATLEDLDNLYNYENIPIGQAEVIHSPPLCTHPFPLQTFKSFLSGVTGVCSLQIDFCVFIIRDVLSIISHEPFLQNTFNLWEVNIVTLFCFLIVLHFLYIASQN